MTCIEDPALRAWNYAKRAGKRSAGGLFGVKSCAGCRLADVAAAVLLVLTTVPAETVRAVRVTGGGTGELLWASPVGQVARTGRRKWREATVDLPKARRRQGNELMGLRIAAGRSRPLWTCPRRDCLMDCSLGRAPHRNQCRTENVTPKGAKVVKGRGRAGRLGPRAVAVGPPAAKAAAADHQHGAVDCAPARTPGARGLAGPHRPLLQSSPVGLDSCHTWQLLHSQRHGGPKA